MKRRAFLKDSALIAAGMTVSPWMHSSANLTKRVEPYINKKPLESGDLPVLVLEGSPRKRGQIHGESLRTEIHELISAWKDFVRKNRKMDPDVYIDEFVAYQKFEKAIQKWTPDLEEEVKGIAEGSGIDEKTMYAFQLGDEEWWVGMHKRIGIPLPQAHHCSALGVFGQEGLPTYTAQNMDIYSYSDTYEVLLHIKHENSSLESFVYTEAGLIALCGMNNHSLGICCNTLMQLDHCPDGLPVAHVVRGVLAQKDYADAVQFVKNIKHASGQNYTVGGPKEAAAFECSANKVSRFVPYEGAKRVYHTNHPLVNDDQGIYKEVLKKLPEDRKPKSPNNSEIRLAALEKRLKDPAKGITVDAIKETLCSHDDPKNPVCNHIPESGEGGFTFGSLIYELGESPVLHLAPGPPCSTEFKVYLF